MPIRRNTNSRLVASRVMRTSATSDRSISAMTLLTAATLASGAPAVRTCRKIRPPVCRKGENNCGLGVSA